MSNEARVVSSITIRGPENLQYQSVPTAFQATVSIAKGPTPGLVVATQLGVVADLSLLTTPGLCFIANPDDTYPLEIGVYDPDANEFYPMLELLAGEQIAVRLSQFLGQEMGTASAGTGSTGSGVKLMLRGVGGTVNARVEAFNL